MIKQVDGCIQQLGAAGLFRGRHFEGDQDHPWSRLAKTGPGQWRVWSIAWMLLSPHMVKLNTDASVSPAGASGGGILRDHDGRLVFAFYKGFGYVTVVMVEALALW